jgi:hydrogenase/urease accessory protein HupE
MFLAHLMNTGLGPFYDGLIHLFLTPEELLPVVALSLLAGMRGPRFGRAALFVLPTAWLTGTLAGRLSTPHAGLPWVAAVLTLTLGALVAADRILPYASVAVLAAGLGLWNGAWNGMELARSHSATFVTALGTASGVFMVVALLSALSSSVRVPWARIALRVAGSWIAASGLFMLGWSLRPGPR